MCPSENSGNNILMPRFVLLYHDCPPGYVKPSHWDFMLEFDGALRTWELNELPRAWADPTSIAPQTLSARRLADHRIAYLDYEGPLTGDRGNVTQLAHGTFETLEDTPQRLVVKLLGTMIHGIIELAETNQLNHWQLIVRANGEPAPH